MPPLEPPNSTYANILRRWTRSYLRVIHRRATLKRIGCGYVSTIDRCIPVTDDLLVAMREQAGVSVDDLKVPIHQQEQPVNEVKSRADLVTLLLWCMEHEGAKDKVRVNPLSDVPDWLFELFKAFVPDQQQRLGGAPGNMIGALVLLGQEQNAAIFTVFHSREQASVFDDRITFLTADPAGNLVRTSAKDYRRPDNPEVRNYPLEYTPGIFHFGPGEEDKVCAKGLDRLICVAPYAYYDSTGKVDREKQVPAIERIFQFPELDDSQRETYMNQVAANYPYIILAGLQGANPACRKTIEEELHTLADSCTTHVEISGLRALRDWLPTLIPCYIPSIGINEDELSQACDYLVHGIDEPVARSYSSLQAMYDDARDLAMFLKPQRLYVHSHVADLILRHTPVPDQDMTKEIEADLYAKYLVIKRLRAQMKSAPKSKAGIKKEGLKALIDFAGQVSGFAAYARGESIVDTTRLLDLAIETFELAKNGYFNVEDGYAVAVAPVAWFFGDLASELRVTGAGDTSSAVSFVQSDFAVHPN
jgi:ADP-dependent phosphofructokinase/glucokinase